MVEDPGSYELFGCIKRAPAFRDGFYTIPQKTNNFYSMKIMSY